MYDGIEYRGAAHGNVGNSLLVAGAKALASGLRPARVAGIGASSPAP